jgi:hypothetical protein
VTDPKLLAEQQQRAELERLAKEDPDSWAAQALEARNIAIAELALHKKGSPYLTRAIRGLQLAETLERQVWKQRYKADDKTQKQNAGPRQDAHTEENPFTDQLREEHAKEEGRPNGRPSLSTAA